MRSALSWRTTAHQIKAKRCLLDLMEPTGTGCMIWLGMCLSVVGTVIVIMHRLHRLTREGLVWARSACFAVAVGTSMRWAAELRSASTATLSFGASSAAGSVLFCPQVNRELAGGQSGTEPELESDPADAGRDVHAGGVEQSEEPHGRPPRLAWIWADRRRASGQHDAIPGPARRTSGEGFLG